MNRQTLLVATIAVAIGATVAACGDQPTAPRTNANIANAPADASIQRAEGAQGKKLGHLGKDRASLLTNVPVTGTLSDGGTFVGSLTATHLDYDQTAKTLLMTGTLTGTATTAAGVASQVTQQFVNTPITLGKTASPAGVFRATSSAASCGILFLDLGPLHLDLLGLTVDLNEVVLAVNAVSGTSNLLGNLLCAVVNLLDVSAVIGSITHLLDQINSILAGLTLPGATSGAAWVLPPSMTNVGPALVLS